MCFLGWSAIFLQAAQRRRARSVRKPRSSGLRTGFTLVEILLVMAILIVVAAIASPALLNALKDQRLRTGADKVRAEFTRAHVRAMRSGQIQMFRYQLGGSGYQVLPWASGDESIESNQAEMAQSQFLTSGAVQSSPEVPAGGALLPDGVIFAGGDAVLEGRSALVEAETSGFGRSDWSRPILFYPDGSSSDAFVILTGERNVGMRVSLRGLTGSSMVSDIGEVENLMP